METAITPGEKVTPLYVIFSSPRVCPTQQSAYEYSLHITNPTILLFPETHACQAFLDSITAFSEAWAIPKESLCSTQIKHGIPSDSLKNYQPPDVARSCTDIQIDMKISTFILRFGSSTYPNGNVSTVSPFISSVLVCSLSFLFC